MDGFEVDYKKYYKVVRDVVINARLISPGLSTFADNKACTECENSGRKICDDEVVLRLNSENPLAIVNLEDFFTKFDGNALSSVRDKCDLMLYDNVHNRLAFCEMTCTQEKYVKPYNNSRGHNDGKRQYRYRRRDRRSILACQIPLGAGKCQGDQPYLHDHVLGAYRRRRLSCIRPAVYCHNVSAFGRRKYYLRKSGGKKHGQNA